MPVGGTETLLRHSEGATVASQGSGTKATFASRAVSAGAGCVPTFCSWTSNTASWTLQAKREVGRSLRSIISSKSSSFSPKTISSSSSWSLLQRSDWLSFQDFRLSRSIFSVGKVLGRWPDSALKKKKGKHREENREGFAMWRSIFLQTAIHQAERCNPGKINRYLSSLQLSSEFPVYKSDLLSRIYGTMKYEDVKKKQSLSRESRTGRVMGAITSTRP